MKWFVIGYKQGNKRGLDSTNKIGARDLDMRFSR